MKGIRNHGGFRPARVVATLSVTALMSFLLQSYGAPEGKIAYVDLVRVGNHLLTDLEVLNPNSMEGRLLTSGYQVEDDVRWSRDGSRLVFTRGADWASAIFTVAPDGSDLQQVTDFGERSLPRRRDPCFSPDGARIAFTRGSDLYVVHADGSEETLVLRDARSPDWSPDGSRFAFVRGGSVFSVGIDGSDPEQLTSDVLVSGGPRYSQDGTRLLFSGVRFEPQLEFSLEVVNADGSGLTTIASDRIRSIRGVWSGDGSQVVYHLSRGSREADILYRADLDGSPSEAWIELEAGVLASFDIQPTRRIDALVRPVVLQDLSGALAEVAVLGSDSFDVREIVPTSLRMGPGNAAPAHPLDDGFYRNDHLRRVNLDGFRDLVVHFPIEDAGLECGKAVDLWGETTKGQIVWDSEEILIGGVAQGSVFVNEGRRRGERETQRAWCPGTTPTAVDPRPRLEMHDSRVERREARGTRQGSRRLLDPSNGAGGAQAGPR